MSSTPLNTQLPRYIDPRKFAQQGLGLEGNIAVSELSRLMDVSLNNSDEVKVVLEFGVDEERHRVITGQAKCVLTVMCQRCLGPTEVPLEAELNLAIVWDEERAKQLPKALDPVILGEGQADIYTIIEDELLLNLPMVSYHDEDCVERTSFGDDEAEEKAESSNNPFQVLEQLKGSPKS
ncbi:nucleic acid-binding protein [Aestuariicella hydrocarbonica]|uniref:Large ribosomal RNA subunit accumulation protein YceD n=1 Tax=Pseudomaricurvus hydrocarbonicus TaxID=1470433 RepID=A0A9E5JRK4_9GAMM|nr:YceD family protein [Aestuariicella hydrocarbonica]NHO65234.1 nucleic acid-binding protein [Aestuariicella hydrocarbonica]